MSHVSQQEQQIEQQERKIVQLRDAIARADNNGGVLIALILILIATLVAVCMCSTVAHWKMTGCSSRQVLDEDDIERIAQIIRQITARHKAA